MSSEQLADGVNPLDAELAATWDVLKGYSGRDTDLGIARRFGGAAAAYSLRDIGAMNGSVVRVRREPNDTTAGIDDEERFSANQVQDGTLEKWVNGELETTLPVDVDPTNAAAAYSLRKVKASYSGDAVRIRRSSDDVEVDVAFDSEGKVSASSAITNVAEEGGESGQTTATTLGDFISGTDAFVHTWYDQAGSNNAVQATAANQPKIAESGALLADGIQFDGNNDALNFTDLTLTDASIFTVLDIDGTENLQIILGGSTDITTATMIPMMQTSSTNTQVYKNATVGGAEQGSSQFRNASQITLANRGDAYSELATKDKMLFTMMDVDVAADKVLDGISQVPSDATTWGLKGTMEELIIYNSDQSANRFKIESNINNYYGLYNDANDLTQTEWQNTGAESFSSTSTDGFSYSNSASTSFVGVTLKETLAFGDSVFVSFNASGVTHPDSSDQSPQIRLRDAVGGGDGASDIIQVTNGFNAHTLTYSVSGKSNGDNIVFSEGDTVGGTVTISDFKVSRIARDGFVETWYDQSGNGFDLKSQSADTQPFIVNNGGFTGGVYSPSRLNNSTKQYLEISDPDFDSTNITSSKFGWLAVMANMEENDGSQAGGVILGNTRNTQSYPAGSIALNLSDTNPNGRMFVTNLKTSSTGDFIGAVDNDDLFLSETIGTAVVDGSSLSTFLNGTTGSGTFTDLTLTSNVHFKIFQSSDSANNVYYQNAAQGFIKELMFMQGDTIDDIVTIRNEVNNHYNIF